MSGLLNTGEHVRSHGSHRSADCDFPETCPGYGWDEDAEATIPTASDMRKGEADWSDADADNLPCYPCFNAATLECRAELECDGVALDSAKERKRGTCKDCRQRITDEYHEPNPRDVAEREQEHREEMRARERNFRNMVL